MRYNRPRFKETRRYTGTSSYVARDLARGRASVNYTVFLTYFDIRSLFGNVHMEEKNMIEKNSTVGDGGSDSLYVVGTYMYPRLPSSFFDYIFFSM
jgi:hypothetical protein